MGYIMTEHTYQGDELFQNNEIDDSDMMSSDDIDEAELFESDEQEESADDSSIDEYPELLAVKLIKESIIRENPDDSVLYDLAHLVVAKMFAQLAGCTAKGGMFYLQRKAEGAKSDRARYDQSLISHLLNGLLPVTFLIRELRQFDNNTSRYLDDEAYAFFVAGYLMHDWEKFPGVRTRLESLKGKGFKPDPIRDKELVHEVFLEWLQKIGLDEFFEKRGIGLITDHLDTLIWIAYNTQDKHDTYRPTIGFDLTLNQRVCVLCATLTKLSDKFASIVKKPSDVSTESIRFLLNRLSDERLQFAYHTISEVRGVLANIINNAVIDAHKLQSWKPFLFFPNGTAYIGSVDAGIIESHGIPESVIKKLRELCAEKLFKRQVGFDRGGTGLKFADYYWQFFDIPNFILFSAEAAPKQIHEGKKPASFKRSESLIKYKQKEILPDNVNVEFSDDWRIDLLAEYCDLIERKLWREYWSTYKTPEPFNLAQIILEALNIEHLKNDYDLVRQAETKGKAGGVPLAWYFVSASFFAISSNKGKDTEQMRDLVMRISNLLAEKIEVNAAYINSKSKHADGWKDLKQYIKTVVSISQIDQQFDRASLNIELKRYENAKLARSVKPCALCSSSFEIQEQMESGVLFAPQVYTNKQILFSSQAKRNICSICSTEMMLRQILMNRTRSKGGDFEDSKYRYLYIYPSYYFTPETNSFLRRCYNKLAAANFEYGIRKYLIDRKNLTTDLSIEKFQSLDTFLINESLNIDDDRNLKLEYPDDEALSFYFIGIKPGRDATDTESWVMPAFLSLVLPFVFDAKIVSSESSIPIFKSGEEFAETVFIDAPHPFVTLLIGDHRLRLDEIASDTKPDFDLVDWKGPLLQRLTAAYLIHLDANGRSKNGKFDANWGALIEVVRDIATSPLYVFHYFNKWFRQQTKIDTPPINKVRQYLKLYTYFDPKGEKMSHPRKLTELYRNFYRAKSYFAKSNAILKPIDVAADALLKTGRSAISKTDNSLVDYVAGEVSSMMRRVHNDNAEGRWIFKPSESEQERLAIREFSDYFVNTLFVKEFNKDLSRLAGTQINLIRNACDLIYRETDDQERAEKKQNNVSDNNNTNGQE